ncbi:hypothetical protein MNBD_ALPHA01-797 [hydrothermal vent metagenome]|uniref:Uncharacterized protein n=1 Tax=hydrothermal vent metagenome TaxID=652676 RepID=A0A3B0SPQ6_9ZZZZ
MKKSILRIFGIIGVIVFVPLFLLTFSDPHSIERVGKSFIEWKLNSVAEKKIDAIHIPTSTRLDAFLNKKIDLNKKVGLNKKASAKLEELKQQLKDELPKILAAQIAKMSDITCACRLKWEERLASTLKIQISTIETAKIKIATYSQAKYMEISEKLTRDVRIFLGINSLVFLIFLFVSFLKPRAIIHLFVPGILLFLSTIFCSYFYIFEQNWFLTILYDDYTGFAYLSYLTFTFLILSDIVFNKARVTTEIINGIFSAMGRVADISPC